MNTLSMWAIYINLIRMSRESLRTNQRLTARLPVWLPDEDEGWRKIKWQGRDVPLPYSHVSVTAVSAQGHASLIRPSSCRGVITALIASLAHSVVFDCCCCGARYLVAAEQELGIQPRCSSFSSPVSNPQSPCFMDACASLIVSPSLLLLHGHHPPTAWPSSPYCIIMMLMLIGDVSILLCPAPSASSPSLVIQWSITYCTDEMSDGRFFWEIIKWQGG